MINKVPLKVTKQPKIIKINTKNSLQISKRNYQLKIRIAILCWYGQKKITINWIFHF